MKRFEEQRRHQRRASTVEMNPEFEQKLGRFKPPAISDDDLKIMTIQRNAALLMREHPSLKRILKNHDFDRDLPDADRLHQVAMLFETGGLGIRKSPKDALRFHKFAAVLGHHRSQGVMGEYYETGTTEQRNPRRARALYRESSRASDSRAQYDLEPRKGGEGDLKTDYNHAKRYYGMAANQGCERSAFNLGHLFEKGLVITENDVVRYALAKQWYERAEALGYARAEQRIAHIATLDAASPEPTVEEKKKEADSDVDEMMDSDNGGDDERAGRGPRLRGREHPREPEHTVM
ncbi:hypothetical protein JL721_5319 [Aureococcus anophagefferens]|nr:hypothetical protein JL721_5319 [Aureococcus anophagefferens]